MTQRQQLKLEIKNILKEVFYNKMVGIHELVLFYHSADEILINKVDALFKHGNNEDAWELVKKFLIDTNQVIHLKENWKSVAAAGLVGISSLLPTTAKANPASHKPAIAQTANSSIVDTIKKYENDKFNPKGGWNKSENRWYPMNSLEGGSKTIAYGHKIVSGENFDKGLTDSEALQLLKKDIALKASFAKKKMTEFEKFPSYVKSAIINALFRGDMGPKTVELINKREWNKVAPEYLNHTNYKNGKYKQIVDRMKSNADAFSRYAVELKSRV
jgi:GH24 family phage-related lysozyme (muramidase)